MSRVTDLHEEQLQRVGQFMLETNEHCCGGTVVIAFLRDNRERKEMNKQKAPLPTTFRSCY
jgi:hypothetical protein